MTRVYALVLLLTAAMLSSACYVTQDANGDWWACETYQTPSGPVEGCQLLPARPF